MPLSVSSTSWIISGSKPALFTATRMRSARHLFEFIASLPPRRITALPLLRLSIAASTVTLGRASYIMPTTPIGTRTLSIFMPLGRVLPSITSPTGSGYFDSASQAFAMLSILASLSASLSSRDSLILRILPFSRSTALASIISFLLLRRICAISSSASFFMSDEAKAIVPLAACAL